MKRLKYSVVLLIVLAIAGCNSAPAVEKIDFVQLQDMKVDQVQAILGPPHTTDDKTLYGRDFKLGQNATTHTWKRGTKSVKITFLSSDGRPYIYEFTDEDLSRSITRDQLYAEFNVSRENPRYSPWATPDNHQLTLELHDAPRRDTEEEWNGKSPSGRDLAADQLFESEPANEPQKAISAAP